MKEDPLPILLNIFTQIEVNFFHLENLLILFVIIILLVSSAFVSGAEISYFSLNMSDIEKLKEKNEKNKLIYELIKNPNSLLATILISKNLQM